MSTGAPVTLDSLTEEEKSKCRYYLGYLQTETAPSIQLGIPKPLQTVFLLEQALNLIQSNFAAKRVRIILCRLDAIETALCGAIANLGVSSVDKIDLHPLKSRGILTTDSLERENSRWANRLADTLGVPLYPFSDRFKRKGPGVSVRTST